MISSSACTSPLHVFLFLHVHLPYTYLFSCMHVFLTHVDFPSYMSTLHMMLFLHVRLHYMCYFSCMRICLPHCDFPQNWSCAQQAPNTDIMTRRESLPKSTVCHFLCQHVIHFSDSLALCLSLDSPFGHIFHELRGDWFL